MIRQRAAESMLLQQGDRLEVRVASGAASNRLLIENKDNGRMMVKVHVTAIAEKCKANAAVLELLSEKLGLAKGSFRLIRGKTSQNKLFEVVE